MPDSLRQILADTRELLDFQAEIGMSELPLTPELRRFLAGPEKPAAREAAPPPRPAPPRPARPAPPPAPRPTVIPANGQPIGEIHQELAGCCLCPLHQTRQRVVAGSGGGDIRLLVIDAPPGEAEEAGGSPLAGEAGGLFDKMLQAIGLQRQKIYLTPLVKCRPPADREPSEAEVHACLNFLYRQIAAINPTVICGLGPLAARILTGSDQPLFRLRGRFYDFHGTPLLVSFHPAFLLRNPEMKKASWQDLQLLQKKLAGAKG